MIISDCYINSITSLIILQILLGFGQALGTPSFNAIFAKHLDSGVQIKQYSQWKMLEDTVTAVGVLMGGIIVTKFGFTPLFLIMSLLSLITTVTVALQPRERL